MFTTITMNMIERAAAQRFVSFAPADNRSEAVKARWNVCANIIEYDACAGRKPNYGSKHPIPLKELLLSHMLYDNVTVEKNFLLIIKNDCVILYYRALLGQGFFAASRRRRFACAEMTHTQTLHAKENSKKGKKVIIDGSVF